MKIIKLTRIDRGLLAVFESDSFIYPYFFIVVVALGFVCANPFRSFIPTLWTLFVTLHPVTAVPA